MAQDLSEHGLKMPVSVEEAYQRHGDAAQTAGKPDRGDYRTGEAGEDLAAGNSKTNKLVDP